MPEVTGGSSRPTASGSGLVSVVIPVYANALLAKALRSVFQQTFRRFEVIVVNDGSPDAEGVDAAVAPYREQICYVTQPNAGAGAARNAALSRARGEYVAFLDADDRWLPTFLDEQLALLTRSGADLAYCDAIIVGESPRAGRRYMELAPSRAPITLNDLLSQQSSVLLSGVIARRQSIEAAGCFDPSLRRGQDFGLWLQMAANGCRIVFQRKILVERHECSKGTPEERIADLDRVLAVLSKAGRTLNLPASSRTALAARIGWAERQREVECAKRALMRRHFEEAVRHLDLSRERSLKVQIARATLMCAPRLAARAYTWWRAWLERRRRRRQVISSRSSESASI